MPRLDIKLAAQRAGRTSASDARCMLLGLTIAEQSTKQYVSRRKIVQEFCTEAKIPLNREGFFLFLLAAGEQLQGRLEGYRAAIAHFQKVEAEHPWADDEDIRLATKGAFYKGKAPRTKEPKGSLTMKMFEDLISFCQERYPEFVIPFAVIYLAALRVKQGMFLRAGDLLEEGDDLVLLVRKDKRVSKDSKEGEVHLKPVPEEFRAIWAQAVVGKKHGDWVFSPREVPYSRALEIIKEAATVLKWPVGLDYAGPHALRHGGTALIVRRVEELVRGYYTQMSTGTSAAYSSGNAQRLRKRKR